MKTKMLFLLSFLLILSVCWVSKLKMDNVRLKHRISDSQVENRQTQAENDELMTEVSVLKQQTNFDAVIKGELKSQLDLVNARVRSFSEASPTRPEEVGQKVVK